MATIHKQRRRPAEDVQEFVWVNNQLTTSRQVTSMLFLDPLHGLQCFLCFHLSRKGPYLTKGLVLFILFQILATLCLAGADSALDHVSIRKNQTNLVVEEHQNRIGRTHKLLATRYTFTGAAITIAIPPGTTSMIVTLYGASGSDHQTDPTIPSPLFEGGNGGMISATIPVSSGISYNLYIGGEGGDSAGGFNGGGAAGASTIHAHGGGGATDLRKSPFSLADRLLVAGGGGSAAGNCPSIGAHGGYPAGATAVICSTSYYGGGGGTEVAGGAPGDSSQAYCTSANAGSSGQGGASCSSGSAAYGGGGGGGWFGGGGAYGAGGGGGSSYSVYPITSHTTGANNGAGYADIEFIITPTFSPTLAPISAPTYSPTRQPTRAPTCEPSESPTITPTRNPTTAPTLTPTLAPTKMPTASPTLNPTLAPTCSPTFTPTASPTCSPTLVPTATPTLVPTCAPTKTPTASPTLTPTAIPTLTPTCVPTTKPTCYPTSQPSGSPTRQPTAQPSRQPSIQPTRQPSSAPTRQPSSQPSAGPTMQPSSQPTSHPSRQPSGTPSAQPSRQPSSAPSRQPSSQPSTSPTAQPSAHPSSHPSRQPTRQPSNQPSGSPSTQPSRQPSSAPSRQPTSQPSGFPSSQPSARPSSQPSRQPTRQPSNQPSSLPTAQPTRQPSSAPSRQPSAQPSSEPSRQPSAQPSMQPSGQPSSAPSSQPSGRPSSQPSAQPSASPTTQPTSAPSSQPSLQPTRQPTSKPSSQPSARPSGQPSAQPSSKPSRQPTSAPSRQPSAQPSAAPSRQPSARPSEQPSSAPSAQPSSSPTAQPTRQPSSQPSASPTMQPTFQPSRQPSSQPTVSPSAQPSASPTSQPSSSPTSQPSTQPSSQPSAFPTSQPTGRPSSRPSSQPSSAPSSQPSTQPSGQPSSAPSSQPSTQPSLQPSSQPSSAPSSQPSAAPTIQPSSVPSMQPSSLPSGQPSLTPTVQPSSQPSKQPSTQPSSVPSAQPSMVPTGQPSSVPSAQPTAVPSSQPSAVPSSQPSQQPSTQPSAQPSSEPSSQPTAQPSSLPSSFPTTQPSSQPSAQPSGEPTAQPSSHPSFGPTSQPSSVPSSQPTSQPSRVPSVQPSGQPTSVPSSQPSSVPSAQPSSMPSDQPSGVPTTQPTEEPSGQPTSSPSRQPTEMPTSQPSRQPSSRPSRQPSSQPSGNPSSQPSVTPSTQPSASPTSTPSSQPSGEPTSSPTAVPTAQPTSQPSRLPTAQPSKQPRADPTSQPSIRPTASPTSAPTAFQSSRTIYSKAPSASPTLSPTWSESEAWANQMQVALAGVVQNDTSAVAHRSTYYELDVASNNPFHKLGGCAAWSSVLFGDLNPSQYTYKARSISVVKEVDYNTYDRSESYSAWRATCEDPATVTGVIGALLGEAKLSGGVTVSHTFQCSGASWVVRHCTVTATGSTSVTYSPALCVGCTDPCSPTLHCNSNPNAAQVNAGVITVSPCVQQQCPGTTKTSPLSPATSLRILSVSFSEIEKAPSLLSVSIVRSKTSLKVSARMSSGGSVFCAAYKATATVSAPAKTDDVVRQNNVALAGAGNVSTVIVQGLEAATDYIVYVMTVSPIGVRSSLEEVFSTASTVTTECCKAVTVSLSTVSGIEKVSIPNALSVTLGAAPSTGVMLQFNLYSVSSVTGALALHEPSFFPALLWVSRTANPSASLRASLPALPVGIYEYRIVLSGSAAWEYQVSNSSQGQRIEILSAATEPTVPTLTQATFSGDGSYMSIAFSSSTNRGGTATSFPCSTLFEFDCTATSRCQWVDSSTVRASVTSTSASGVCARPGSPLRLQSSAVVKAKCQMPNDACPNYAGWQTVATIIVYVNAPASPVAPSVSISAPSVLGSCDDLSLDLSSSTGSGGRAWVNSSIVVLSSVGNDVSVLSSELRKISVLVPPPKLAATLLTKGQNYNFVVTLCNFLGQCSVGSKQVLVLNDTMPSVSLPGPALRTITRKDALLLSSSAFVSTCGGGRSSAGLGYKWSISNNGVQLLNTPSLSKDPSKFLLSSYALESGLFYKVTLSVRSSSSVQSSEVSKQIFVQAGSLLANIKGGSVRTMRVSDPILLDASSSVDEDMVGVTGAAAGMQFSWSCVQTLPHFNATCDDILEKKRVFLSASPEFFTVAPKASAAGAECQVTVEVLDASLLRTSRMTVTVSILAALAPVVSVSAPNAPRSGVVNAGQLLQLKGSFSVPASIGGNATWIVDDSSVKLVDALFPQSVVIPASPTASVSAVASVVSYMAFAPNTLPEGTTLTFSLVGTIPYLARRSVGSVTIVVNAPPSSGSFLVTPPEGAELEKSFQFSAQQWVDPDLPISYQFGYISNSAIEVVLRSRLELPFGTSLLTAGQSELDFAVVCSAQVFDSLNAATSASSTVKVTKNSEMNSSQIDAFIRSSMSSAAADVDSIKQATALSSYLLNSANCSLAQDCAALHRESCSTTAHTCGACESDLYIGEEGHSNEACVLIGDVRQLSTSESERKPCAAECSGHGSCAHIMSDSGELITADMPPCLRGAVDCDAVCDCDPDYFGSDTCDLPTASFQQRQENRGQVLGGLLALVGLENPSELVVAGWVNSLTLASGVAAELSSTSSLAVLGLVDSITATAGANAVSPEVMKGLLNAVNSATQANFKSQVRRRLLSARHGLSTSDVSASADTAAENVNAAMGVLNNFGNLYAQSMLPGQSAVQFTEKEFRMSVQVVSTGDASTPSTVTVPQTPLEKHLGKEASKLILPEGSAESVRLVTTSVRAEQHKALAADLKSNVLMLHSSGDLCTSPPCKVQVVIQNSQSIDYDALNSAFPNQTFNATCLKNDFTVHDFACDNGKSVSVTCSGVAGVFFQQCPIVTYAGACNALTSTGALLTGTDSGCELVEYTESAVTCECDVYHHRTAAASSRRLVDGTYNFTEPAGYSVRYVSMLQASADTFVATIGTADDLNASTLTKGWRALATLGALAGAIVFGLLWSHHADYQMKKVAPLTEEKSQAVVPASVSAVKASRADGKKSKGIRGKLRMNSRAKKVLVNAELAVVEESLPRALSSRTFSDRFMEEVKQHHRWFGIIFYFSDSFPRVLRVVSLATNAIVMLFIQSITYNLTNPDDGSCKLLYHESACLEPQSPFATGESKCAWIADSSGGSDGTCVFVEPDKSIRIILFVAIFCAIVTTPIALAADWVVLNILSAATLEETPVDAAAAGAAELLVAGSIATADGALLPDKSSEVMVSNAAPTERPQLIKRKSSSSQLKAYFGLFANDAKLREDKAIMAASHTELMMLGMKLRRYREVLRLDELEEFNILWGLDSEGKFLVQAPAAATMLGRLKDQCTKREDVNVKEAVLMDLKRINESVRDEARQLLQSGATKHEIGKKLLFLFQCDLLPGISGKILELKGKRDTCKTKHVSFKAKVAGWTFLFLLDTGMLFYILLFALTQTGPRQNAWFQSFALWLVLEILLVSTAIVFFTHIVIPSLIMKDLSQIKRRLMDNIRDFNEKVSEDKGATEKAAVVPAEDITFNAANFLFVSSRLARQFPDLKESKIIAQFSTPWPRQSYLHVQNVSKKYSKKFSALTRSASILLIFFVGNFLSVPPSCQDIVMQMTSTTAIGYIVLIHVQLFEIFPALVILPSLVVALLAHFVIQSSKSDAKIKLARLFPSINKKKKAQQDGVGTAYSVDDGAAADVPEGVADAPAVGAVALYGDEESKDSSDYDVDSGDEIGVTVALPAGGAHGVGVHKTRRQSIQTGLDLLHSMQVRHPAGPAGSASSPASSSEETSGSEADSSDSDSEGDSEGDSDGGQEEDHSSLTSSGDGSGQESDEGEPEDHDFTHRDSLHPDEVDCQLLHMPLSFRSPHAAGRSSRHSSTLSNPILRLLSSSVSSDDDSSCSDNDSGDTGDSADGEPARSDSIDSWEQEVLPRRESMGDANRNSHENLHLPKAVPPPPSASGVLDARDAVNDFSSVSSASTRVAPPLPLSSVQVVVPCGEVIQEEASHSADSSSGEESGVSNCATARGVADADQHVTELHLRNRSADAHSGGGHSASETSSSGDGSDASDAEAAGEGDAQDVQDDLACEPGAEYLAPLVDRANSAPASDESESDQASDAPVQHRGADNGSKHSSATDSDGESQYDLVNDFAAARAPADQHMGGNTDLDAHQPADNSVSDLSSVQDEPTLLPSLLP